MGILKTGIIQRHGESEPFGAFGGDEIAWTQATAVQNTWYEIADADTAVHVVNLVSFADSELTVARSGPYEIIWAASVQCSQANKHIQVGIMVNAQAPTKGINHVVVLGISQSFALSGLATIELSANDVVSLGIRTTDTGTPDITVDHIMMSLKRVGET